MLDKLIQPNLLIGTLAAETPPHKHTHNHFHFHSHIHTVIYTYVHKRVDKFNYVGNSVSSTEKDINTRLAKAWTTNGWSFGHMESELTDKTK